MENEQPPESGIDTGAAPGNDSNAASAEEQKKSGCNPNQDDLYEYDSIPVGVRLTIHQKGKIEQLKAAVARPRGAYPETHLPTWPTQPMIQKIPLVEAPNNTIIISRGRLCKQLIRPTKCFRVDDPLHMETIIAPPYDALHDPSAKNYITKPVVEQTLLKQKLCNTSGQVFCSLKTFNQYRRYLDRQLYTVDVNEMIQNGDMIIDQQRQQMKAIQKERNRNSGREFYRKQKLEFATKYKEDQIKDRAVRLKWKMTNEYYQLESHRCRVEEERERRHIQGLMRDQFRDEKVRALHIERINARAALMKKIADQDKEGGKRVKEEKMRKANARKEYLLELLDAKLEVQIQKLKNDKHVAESILYANQQRTEARQRKVESHRAQMPAIIRKRKEKEKRLWAIVRKYFNRWVEKVRARRARRPDAMHKSLWDIPAVFDATVVYLRKESGYEKLDDFIMGIVKLKRDIKAELEAEEAAEKAALAAEQAAGPIPKEESSVPSTAATPASPATVTA